MVFGALAISGTGIALASTALTALDAWGIRYLGLQPRLKSDQRFAPQFSQIPKSDRHPVRDGIRLEVQVPDDTPTEICVPISAAGVHVAEGQANPFAMRRAIASTSLMLPNIGNWYSNLNSSRDGSRPCAIPLKTKRSQSKNKDCEQDTIDAEQLPSSGLKPTR
jgi:hypothetical protein